MIDLAELLNRLERHWIATQYPTGPIENPAVMAKDCKDAAQVIRELQEKLCQCGESA